MCFRPTEIQMNKCPVCGKTNKPIAKECEECGVLLEEKKVDFDADQARLDASITAPSAPKPPAAPPSAPGTPKP